jgi:YARHG domain
MKKILSLALLALLFFSCKDEPKKEVKLAQIIETESKEDYYGIWTGDLKPVFDETNDTLYVPQKKITLKINRIVDDVVYGHSIIDGVQRPLRGKMTNKDGDTVIFTLDEPGTEDTDGRYELELLKGSFMEGQHVLFKENATTTQVKTLRLVHKQFVYNPNFMLSDEVELVDWSNPKIEKYVYNPDDYEGDEGSRDSIPAVENDTIEDEEYVEVAEYYRTASDQVFKINGSTTKLAEEDLKNLRKLDLEIIRNSIFARHGFAFKTPTVRSFFEASYWYVPISDNVDKELTALEKQNIALLKRLEEYAEDHYDSFGR